MRLIDADALCVVMNTMAAEAFDECEEHTIRGCLGVVQRMPTVDAVEVVRCKDCNVPHNKWLGCPNLNGLIPPPDFFCARGERREDNAVD